MTPIARAAELVLWWSLLLAGGLTFATWLASVPWPAAAHGDAQWIADNPRYVDRDHMHCCGVADCRREHASKFREAPEGVYVATGAGVELLMPRRLVGAGLYPSIDGDWWICIRAGQVRCVFKPTSGF